MKVLLSAYACEPGKGSEPAVGWGWALALARRGHRVTVLTRANNRPVIEGAASATRGLPITFAYCDPPAWIGWWKKARRGIHLYYLLWQWCAYRRAKRLHAGVGFERVHHVTFASMRQPSFLGGLGIPFVFGPVAGGDWCPPKLMASAHWRYRLYERLLPFASRLSLFDPLVRRTLRQATAIYSNTASTLRLVPARYRHKTRVRLAVGWDDADDVFAPPRDGERDRELPLRVLFVGRLVPLKGLHLALAAFAAYVSSAPGAELTVVGAGPDGARLARAATRLGIAGRVHWRGALLRRELAAVYRSHDLLLFPSLRDSGGMVVLEAFASGLPVVCLDIAGPGAIVDETCGIAVAADGDEAEVVRALATALHRLADDERLRRRLVVGGFAALARLRWDTRIAEVERDLEVLDSGTDAGHAEGTRDG